MPLIQEVIYAPVHVMGVMPLNIICFSGLGISGTWEEKLQHYDPYSNKPYASMFPVKWYAATNNITTERATSRLLETTDSVLPQ